MKRLLVVVGILFGVLLVAPAASVYADPPEGATNEHRGKSPSNPDGGGVDKPYPADGQGANSQVQGDTGATFDGNNGCGQDRRNPDEQRDAQGGYDDNNGHCGPKPRETQATGNGQHGNTGGSNTGGSNTGTSGGNTVVREERRIDESDAVLSATHETPTAVGAVVTSPAVAVAGQTTGAGTVAGVVTRPTFATAADLAATGTLVEAPVSMAALRESALFTGGWLAPLAAPRGRITPPETGDAGPIAPRGSGRLLYLGLLATVLTAVAFTAKQVRTDR